MSEENLCILEHIMLESEDFDLFPADVVALFESDSSGPHQARKLFAKRIDANNPKRAEAQREHLANLRLWAVRDIPAATMATFNGVGTKLYGTHDESPTDGTYISTLYFTFLFIPLLPIQSYWITEEGDTYYFHGKTVHPPEVMRTMLVVWGLIFAAIALISWNNQPSSTVGIWNGFERDVIVTIDDKEHRVATHTGLKLYLEPKTWTATTRFVDSDTTFETVELRMTDRTVSPTIYNVGARAILEVEYWTYGNASPPDDYVLLDRVSYPRDLYYIFRSAPAQGNNGSIRTALEPVAFDDWAALMYFATNDHPEMANTFAHSALLDGSSDAQFIRLAAGVLLSESYQLNDFCDEILGTHPNEVQRHRFCQTAIDQELTETIEQYRALAASHPDSPMYAYLHGRLLNGDEGIALFRKALDLDPEYAIAHMALGYNLLVSGGAPQDAAASYLRAASDPEMAQGVGQGILITGQLLGLSEQVLIDQQPPDDSSFTMQDLIRVQHHPQTLSDELKRIAKMGENWDPTDVYNVQLNAAVAAGDINQLRRIAKTADVMPFQLVLSDGALPIETVDPTMGASDASRTVLWWYANHLAQKETSEQLNDIRQFSDSVADLLESGDFTEQSVLNALRHQHMDLWAPVYFVAYRETGNVAFGKTAKQWAQPGQLPIFTP